MYLLTPHSSTTLSPSNHSMIRGTRVKDLEWAYIKFLKGRKAMDHHLCQSTDPLMVTFNHNP